MNLCAGKTRTVNTSGTKISYSVMGNSDPEAIVICLIASTGRGPEDFVHLANYLTDRGVRVIMPWPRGTGLSENNEKHINFHDLASDVEAVVLVEKDDGPVILAGHAYGCWIARTLAADRPDLIDGLAFLAAAGADWSPKLSDAIDTAMSEQSSEPDRIAALRLAFFAEGDPSPWLKGWYPELAHLQRRARQRTNPNTWWDSGNAPILDLIGLKDPFRPPDQHDYYVRELGSRVEVQTIKGASHALPDEKPKETADALIDWVNKLPKTQSSRI